MTLDDDDYDDDNKNNNNNYMRLQRIFLCSLIKKDVEIYYGPNLSDNKAFFLYRRMFT